MDKNTEFQRQEYITFRGIDKQNKIDWRWVSTYPHITDDVNIVHLFALRSDPGAFTYDYDNIKYYHSDISRELIQYLCHPRFIEKWLNEGNEVEDYLS